TADDGSVIVPASQTGTGPSLFVYRAGAITALAKIGDATDIDTGLERFRFSGASVRDAAERAVFFGSRDGVFVADSSGGLQTVAFIGGPTPPGRPDARFGPPAPRAAGGAAFCAAIPGGRGGRPRAGGSRAGVPPPGPGVASGPSRVARSPPPAATGSSTSSPTPSTPSADPMWARRARSCSKPRCRGKPRAASSTVAAASRG